MARMKPTFETSSVTILILLTVLGLSWLNISTLLSPGVRSYLQYLPCIDEVSPVDVAKQRFTEQLKKLRDEANAKRLSDLSPVLLNRPSRSKANPRFDFTPVENSLRPKTIPTSVLLNGPN